MALTPGQIFESYTRNQADLTIIREAIDSASTQPDMLVSLSIGGPTRDDPLGRLMPKMQFTIASKVLLPVLLDQFQDLLKHSRTLMPLDAAVKKLSQQT